jgi:urea transporter
LARCFAAFYAERQWGLLAYVVLACAAASVVTAAMQKFLDSQHVPSLTAAFVVTVWVFLAAMYQFGRLRGLSPPLPAPHLPAQSPGPMGTVAPVDWLTGVFRGFSQVFLQNSVWSPTVGPYRDA